MTGSDQTPQTDADQAHGWACGWEAALDHYRSLPVEQRMEAMGMLPNKASFDGGMTWEDIWTE